MLGLLSGERPFESPDDTLEASGAELAFIIAGLHCDFRIPVVYEACSTFGSGCNFQRKKEGKMVGGDIRLNNALRDG